MCVSSNPAAFVQSGGGLISHESAGTNYQQALSDHNPNNTDNPSLMTQMPGEKEGDLVPEK